jgi:hypothetical protein
VDASQRIPGYSARPNPHGYITRNLHYFDANGDCFFAFSVAQNWLLFYLRRPAETHPSLSAVELQRSFSHVKQTQNGELNFRIRTLQDATEAMRLVFGVTPFLDTYSFPDEVGNAEAFVEGAVASVTVNSFERNREAREACIRHYGSKCVVCAFDFQQAYGQLGLGFIHVHHLVELSSIRREYKVDPIRDLRPVCPNCHAMLHRRVPPLSVEELQRILTSRSSGPTTAWPRDTR